MFKNLRMALLALLGARHGTAVTVGSYISTDDQHSVTLTLADGWVEAKARLSPAGARRISEQLKTWADAAEQNNSVGQWQAIIRYATVKKESGDVDAAPSVAEAT